MRSHIALMTIDGEAVIPEEIREHLGIAGGDSLEFVIRDDGTVVVRSPLEEVFGVAEVVIPQPPDVALEAEVEEAMGLYTAESGRDFSC